MHFEKIEKYARKTLQHQFWGHQVHFRSHDSKYNIFKTSANILETVLGITQKHR